MLPKRNNKTDLNNSELLLLDFLATLGPTTAFQLSNNEYSIHMYVSYSHNLNFEETNVVLDNLYTKKLVSRKYGIISSSKFDNKLKKHTFIKTQGFTYSLNEKGGAAWSTERTPIWEKYCDYRLFNNEKNNEFIEFASINKATAYECAKHFHCFRFHNFNLESLKFTESPRYPLLYWKSFQYECSWRTLLLPFEDIDIDWNKFHETRNYWRNLKELQKFI